MRGLFSTKPVPGAKKIWDHCTRKSLLDRRPPEQKRNQCVLSEATKRRGSGGPLSHRARGRPVLCLAHHCPSPAELALAFWSLFARTPTPNLLLLACVI